MRRFWTCGSIALALFLAGCGGPQAKVAASEILGTWKVDAERVREQFARDMDAKIAVAADADKGIFEQRKDEGLQKLASFQMTVTFAEDQTYSGTLSADGNTEKSRGTWKKVQGGWRLTPTHENGEAVSGKTVMLRMEGDQLVGGETPEHTFSFRRGR